MKRKVGKLFVGILLSALVVVPARSAAPAETLEHDVIRPVPGSALVEALSGVRELDAFQFPAPPGAGGAEFRMVQGRKWFLAYMSPERESSRPPVSRADVIRHFKSLIERRHGRMLYEDDDRLYFTVILPGGKTCWVYVWASDLGYYNLHIVEEAAPVAAGGPPDGPARGGAPAGNPRLAEIRALLKAAEDAYVSGEKLSAMNTLKTAMSLVGRELPLTASHVRLVEDTIRYQTRKGNVFEAGEPVRISCRLTGYEFRREGRNYTVDIATDFLVLAGDGEILGSQENAFTFSHTSPGPDPEFPMDLTYELSDAPPGTYTIHTVIRDNNSNKQTKFVNEIVIR